MSIRYNHQYLLNMCIKPLYLSVMLKEIIQVYNTSLGKVTECPIGLVSTGKGKFLENTKSKSCKWVRWIRDVLTRGAVKAEKCRSFACGCLCRRRVAPVLDAIFSKPNHTFILFSLFIFSFKRLIRGHCPGMVTSGGNVTHKYFHKNEKAGS
jgi:hypothetical protein